jgi:hypothetical protein
MKGLPGYTGDVQSILARMGTTNVLENLATETLRENDTAVEEKKDLVWMLFTRLCTVP